MTKVKTRDERFEGLQIVGQAGCQTVQAISSLRDRGRMDKLPFSYQRAAVVMLTAAAVAAAAAGAAAQCPEVVSENSKNDTHETRRLRRKSEPISPDVHTVASPLSIGNLGSSDPVVVTVGGPFLA